MAGTGHGSFSANGLSNSVAEGAKTLIAPSRQKKMFYFMLHFILVIGSFTWFMSTMDSIITVNSLHVQLFEQRICTVSVCTESLISYAN